MAIRPGITRIVIMVTIRHGMPRIATHITPPGGPIVVTTHSITVVTTSTVNTITTGVIVEVGTTATREMTTETAVTVAMKMRTGMKILLTAVTKEMNLTVTARHGLTAMYPRHPPGIQATGAW
jgi:hypothetical protein